MFDSNGSDRLLNSQSFKVLLCISFYLSGGSGNRGRKGDAKIVLLIHRREAQTKLTDEIATSNSNCFFFSV